MKELSHCDIISTKSRYAKRFQAYGHDQKSVGWGEKGRQIERFKILLDSLKLDSSVTYHVLDIGAGFGDLYKFLNDSNFVISSYTAFELVTELAEAGCRAYGMNKNFQLHNEDFLKSPFSNSSQFDVAFMSGCFNFQLLESDNYEYIETCLRKAFDLCRIGVSANFITNRVDFQEDYIFYSNPERIIDIAYKISRRFILDHSYFPFEFTLALSKDQAYTRAYPVFNDKRLA